MIVTEFNPDNLIEYAIDTTALIRACELPVFEDSYGAGVALYDGQSCATYHELAECAGLNILDFVEETCYLNGIEKN